VILLAVETSGTSGSLAIGDPNNLPACHQVEWQKKAMHSEVAVSELLRLFKLSGYQLQDVTHICVNIGPGSFTGLRVGVNLARTLAYARKLPIAGISRLALVADAFRKTQNEIFIALKSIQNTHFVAAYRWESEGPRLILDPQSAEAANLTKLEPKFSNSWIEGRDSEQLDEIKALNQIGFVAKWPNLADFSTWKSVKPLYIRRSEAEEKLSRGLLKPSE